MTKRKIQYYEVTLNEELRRKAFFKKNNCATLPQVQIGDEIIGGYTSLWEKLKPSIDHAKLGALAESATRNLNKIIDKNF